MNFISQAGEKLLNKVGDGTARILQVLSFVMAYKSGQLIISNMITNALGLAARSINSVGYAPYDASWLLGQVTGTVQLRGEFFIIAFMNSASQFLLGALIGYELGQANGWCKPYNGPDRWNKNNTLFHFNPFTVLVFYLIPQPFSPKSRHVHANVNKTLLTYLVLYLILASIDIWSTTMFRIAVPETLQNPTGQNMSVLPVAVFLSFIYNIVLAEFGLLMSGGIAIVSVLDAWAWITGKVGGRTKKITVKDKPDTTNRDTSASRTTPQSTGGSSGQQRNVPRGQPQMARSNTPQHVSSRSPFPSRPSGDDDINSLLLGRGLNRVDEDDD